MASDWLGDDIQEKIVLTQEPGDIQTPSKCHSCAEIADMGGEG